MIFADPHKRLFLYFVWTINLIIVPFKNNYLKTKVFLSQGVKWIKNPDGAWTCAKTSLLRRLQEQALPDEAPPIGKIYPFSKMVVTFEPLK